MNMRDMAVHPMPSTPTDPPEPPPYSALYAQGGQQPITYQPMQGQAPMDQAQIEQAIVQWQLQQAMLQAQMGSSMAPGMMPQMPASMGGIPWPVETEPDIWMPHPSLVPAGTPPGLECLTAVSSVRVNKVFNTANLLPNCARSEFKVKNEQGELLYKIVRDIHGFDTMRVPTSATVRAFNVDGMEIARATLTRAGACVGNPCLLFCLCCACSESQTFNVQVPPASNIATVSPKRNLSWVRFEVDRADSGEKWLAESPETGWIRTRGQRTDFQFNDPRSGKQYGTVVRNSDYMQDLLFQVHTYTVSFDRDADAKSRALMLMTAHYLAHAHYEDKHQGRRRGHHHHHHIQNHRAHISHQHYHRHR